MFPRSIIGCLFWRPAASLRPFFPPCFARPASASATWRQFHARPPLSRNQTETTTASAAPNKDILLAHFRFSPCHDAESSESFAKSFRLSPEFITEEEEESLVRELDPHLQRQPYEKDHWDDAIVGFRETERKHWNKANQAIVDRLRDCSFDPGCKQLPYVHVLDLEEHGYIKPHIDSVRFCGDTVAVLSLLSDCVLSLVHDKSKFKTVTCLVPRRSLYIIRGTSRYDYTHAIVRNEESIFDGAAVYKSRRISIVCRNDAAEDNTKHLGETKAP